MRSKIGIAAFAAVAALYPGATYVSFVPSPPLQVPPVIVEHPDPNPLLEPEASGVTNADLAAIRDDEAKAIAKELERFRTKNPEELVSVISDAVAGGSSVFSPTYLLSIAVTETRGHILAVSNAGAAGLAQAMPAAILMERVRGKLFITNDYLIGTRAYIMKKPLGDLLTISSRVIDHNTAANRREALRLIKVARKLRTSGMEELEALDRRAPKIFMKRVRAADRHNLVRIAELEHLLRARASTARLKRFRTGVDREYTALMKIQQITWKRYARSLRQARDRVLRREFGASPSRVIAGEPYRAGEVLGKKLDVRFSPTRMAAFLTAHLETKQEQARALGVPADELDDWTAALYNGGLVNVSRLRAGLLDNLRETEQYMRKVSDLNDELDSAAGI